MDETLFSQLVEAAKHGGPWFGTLASIAFAYFMHKTGRAELARTTAAHADEVQRLLAIHDDNKGLIARLLDQAIGGQS